MTNQIKAIIIWLSIAVCLLMHTALETSHALYFKPLPEGPIEGGISLGMHAILLLAMVLPIIMAVLTLFFSTKIFKITSMVFASILVLMNGMHVFEEGTFENPTQLVILTFVAIVAILQVITLNKWRKESSQN